MRRQLRRDSGSRFHIRLLAGSALVPLMLAATPALAQAAAEAQEEQANPGTGTLETPAADSSATDDAIVVTGIRQTIQTSISTKRNETAIVDALSSEEIGDLPALSVGEAIQTITGATTHREKGGATEIAIRGLGPFLSNATFNGREATNGSGDRSVNFNQFPSELINGIKIYKTQQANLVEGGVAGTIELETLKPLEYGRRRLQGEIKGNYSPYQDRISGENGLGWRGTLSYVDQFELGGLGDVGISLGFQRNDTNNPEETVAGSSTWTACDAVELNPSGNCNEITREEGVAGAPYFLAPNSFAWRHITEDDKRDAFFGAVQWQPSEQLDVNLDLQYSDRTYNEQRNDLNLSEMRYGITDPVFNEDGVLQSFSGRTSIEAVSSLLTRSEEYLGGGLDVAWQPTDRLTVVADASYSKTKRSEIERSTRLRSDPLDIYGDPTELNNQRVPYTYTVENGFAPTIGLDDRFDITNHDLFSDDARIRRDQADRNNEIWAVRLDAIYDVASGFLSQIDAGVRYANLTYNDFDDRVEITQDDRAVDREVNLACRTDFPQDGFLGEAPGNNITNWATFDPICLFEGYLGTSDPGRNDDIRAVGNRDVEEQTVSGYVMGTYESALGSMPIRGNFGVRVVNTQLTSNGLRSGLNVIQNPDGTLTLEETGDFETVTIENESTKVLPSVNAIFELQPNVLLRLAGYRAMSRPNPSALGAGRTIQLGDGSEFTSIEDAISRITANGSPGLDPLMSWNADASLEWYPNPDSLVAGALYYKNFTGGFIPILIDEEFVIGGEELTVPVAQTINSDEKSRIWGFELSLANRFSWLPAPLDGLGGRISYNYANSNFENQDIRYGDIFDPETGEISEGFIEPANVSGFSKHVLSAQAYYETGPLSLQAVFNYRSNYYQEFVGGNSQLRYVRGNETFDLRASYDINRNISLRFEAVNLFDEPKITDMPVQGSIRQYHYYGPRYFFGIRARI